MKHLSKILGPKDRLAALGAITPAYPVRLFAVAAPAGTKIGGSGVIRVCYPCKIHAGHCTPQDG